MQVLVEIIAGLVGMLAAVVLSMFGMDASTPRHDVGREVKRAPDCSASVATPSNDRRGC